MSDEVGFPAGDADGGRWMTFHHVGVAVESIDAALGYYTGVFGFEKVAPPIEVPSENVRVCFVRAAPGVMIELVEGLGDDSPVKRSVEAGGGPYHICYEVDDLDAAIRKLRANRCFPFKRFEVQADRTRRFAFLLTPDRQVFELCESGDRDSRTRLPDRYTFNNLFFEATRQCNLACPMCMAGSNDHERVARNRTRELTTDEIERHVLATAGEIGIKTITWSGGEFILRPDAVELVRRASAYGYASIVATNGTRMTREMLRTLDEASGKTLVIAVGINSISNENSWTRDADSDTAVAILELCAELGIRRTAVVTVGQHNLQTLDETLQWLQDRAIPFNRSPFTPRGSGREYWQRLRFTRDDMRQVIHPALRRSPLGYISYTPFFLSPELHERLSGGVHNVTVPQNPSIGCWCGTWLGVNAEGDVSPCAILLDDVTCGNVRDKTLRQIVDDSPVFRDVLDRNRLKGKCGRCRYKFTCGGCRAMAYYQSGDLMAEDPTCFFEPQDETTVCEHEAETNRMFRRYVFMIRHSHAKRALLAR